METADSAIDKWKKARHADNEDSRFNTNGDVLTALYRLAETIATADKTIFVVNESWTLRGDILSFSPTSRSFTVTAAGNDGVDVLAQHLDFAQRSANDDSFVTVMYIDNSGHPACGSGTVTQTDTVRVVGFNGELSNGNCGTSFAAPRVAWFVAAKSTQTDQYAVGWQSNIQKLLRLSRQGGAPWYNIYFDVSVFWQH